MVLLLYFLCFSPGLLIFVKNRNGVSFPCFWHESVVQYVVAGVLATLLEVITVSGISLQGKVYTSILLILPDAYLACLIYGLLFIGFNYLIVWILYKKRIFIKIKRTGLKKG